MMAEPRPAPPAAGNIAAKVHAAAVPELIAEKDQIITELRETNTVGGRGGVGAGFKRCRSGGGGDT